MGRKRILGKTTDFITGREINDTDDERYRQKLARFLVENKGYSKKDIRTKHKFGFIVENTEVYSMIDFVVTINGKSFLIIRYGPGSLVTRERPALASARILETSEIPLTVVTNGLDAEVLDTHSGEIIGTGLDSIPSKDEVLKQYETADFPTLSERQADAEKRILSAYDWLEHAPECDDDWCETD